MQNIVNQINENIMSCINIRSHSCPHLRRNHKSNVNDVSLLSKISNNYNNYSESILSNTFVQFALESKKGTSDNSSCCFSKFTFSEENNIKEENDIKILFPNRVEKKEIIKMKVEEQLEDCEDDINGEIENNSQDDIEIKDMEKELALRKKKIMEDIKQYQLKKKILNKKKKKRAYKKIRKEEKEKSQNKKYKK